jgi:predicted TPR repeat methyltransferase
MHRKQNPSPEELNELFKKACGQQQRGELEKARNSYLLLLRHVPEAPFLFYNLGLVHYESGDYLEAVNSFSRAFELAPQDLDALFNLALSQKKNGGLDAATASYEKLLCHDPQNTDALYNLGGCHKDAGRFAEAAESYRRVLQLDPDHLPAANNLAFVYHRSGETEKAVSCYRNVLRLAPDHAGANHMLSALTGSECSLSPESYVLELFDNYSETYDHSLGVQLEYTVPEKLLELFHSVCPDEITFERGLDLGCGTGLCGVKFAGRIGVFDGVDLSPGMIELAAGKKIYSRLEAENIITFLQNSSGKYDLFLAADVLGYIGELEELFQVLQSRATAGCLFGFSTEGSHGEGFGLMENGRFFHAPGYVREVASRTGWTVLGSSAAALRRERGEPVEGMIWFLINNAD